MWTKSCPVKQSIIDNIDRHLIITTVCLGHSGESGQSKVSKFKMLNTGANLDTFFIAHNISATLLSMSECNFRIIQ